MNDTYASIDLAKSTIKEMPEISNCDIDLSTYKKDVCLVVLYTHPFQSKFHTRIT